MAIFAALISRYAMLYYIIVLILGALLGALIAWLVMRGKLNVANTILKERTEEGVQFQQTIKEREETLKEQTEARQQLAVRVEVLSNQLNNLQRHGQETLEAKERAANEAMAAQERRHAEALAAQQARFDETIAKVPP